jgi:D-alanyl-D-alanine carboxypeptidase/D-alanyl-D-alanine-endopeptidase (penicillin-binding protein 4)
MPTLRHSPIPRLPVWALAALALVAVAGAQAKPQATPTEGRALPPEVRSALQRAQLPAGSLSVVIHDASTGQRVLERQAEEPVNPASLMKLLTTAAALDRLGPAWQWSTPVWLRGPVRDGVLEGDLHLQGSGDPGLSQERLWLLLRRVQQLGVREIRGDIVLDQSAFAVPPTDAGAFDGEPLRPYNVGPAALMLNLRSQIYSFVPDPAAQVARVLVEPPLAGHQVDRTVPLVAGPCGDWRAALKAEFDASRTRFAGGYGAACGELNWPVADPDPASFDARLLRGMWQGLGGSLTGNVRNGPPPAGVAPSFEFASRPLLDTVRDINKFSNNLMAQQLFLTLALRAEPGAPATLEAARANLRGWLQTRLGDETQGIVVDNGSGLSRDNRISARQLAQVLLLAYDSPVMSELMSSLPISGIDGTLRRSKATAGRAHLKTGSLRDVAGVAGYVLSHSGRRYVLVAIVNHAQAGAARPALDALVQWAMRDAPLR